MARIPIALQLYSVRDDCAKDFPSVLKAVAKMGYEGVDFAGYYGYEAKDIRNMLDDLGLKVAGAHIGLETLLGDEFQKTVEFHKILGNKFLIVPGLAESRRNSRSAWLDTAKVFNEIAAKLKPEGMYTGYHNHSIEFTPMDGELPWDTFFGNTVPEVVMQIDTGNSLHGGADSVQFLEKYPGRALTVHLKAFSKTNDKALIGEDEVRWADVFRLCETTGKTQWYIVEQESYAYPPLECVEKCLQNLKKMGK
ncbi:TPA: sugar phosphate isomerase/epimerase [bacterium]|nr:sugar phosphate isomerase/epimerase [bacterium]